jgi:Na+-driven multidrug efflux pump
MNGVRHFLTFYISLLQRNGIRKYIPRPVGKDVAPAKRAEVSLSGQLYSLALPSLVENLLQTMLGVVDMMMVGRLGKDAIAGVGLANQIMNLLIVTFMGLAVGNTALVARYVGANQKAEAEKVAKQSLIIGAIIASVIALIGFFGSHKTVLLLGGDPEVSRLGGSFLRIIATGSIVMMVMIIGSGTLRGSGDTRTPMVIVALINLGSLTLFGKSG